MSLAGLKVAVDVQHLYRTGIHARDRGTRFVLPGGVTIYEAAAATVYAQALAGYLVAAGAAVILNDPAIGRLVGPYSHRNREAVVSRASLYLACHLNAGGGDYSVIEYMAAPLTAAACNALDGWISGSLGHLPEIRSQRTAVLVRGERGAVCVEDCGSVPAVILEPFFGDNPKHQHLLTGDALTLVGQLIGQGVASWWRATHSPT